MMKAKQRFIAIVSVTFAILAPGLAFASGAQPPRSSDVQPIRVSSNPESEPLWQIDDLAGRGTVGEDAQKHEYSSDAVKHKTSTKGHDRPEGSVLATKERPAGSVGSGSLPYEYRNRRFGETARVVVVPDARLKSHLSELRPGEVLRAKIPHAVIAFPDERTPVIGRITEGTLKGENLVGEARLEENSHRIMIEFRTLTRFAETYRFKGEVTDVEGNLGLTGEYHSQAWKLFTGDFIASTVAAYFDGLVPRQATVFGQVEDNSVDSAAKRGLAGGAMSTAERFRDKLKKTPEFCETQAADVRVMVIE